MPHKYCVCRRCYIHILRCLEYLLLWANCSWGGGNTICDCVCTWILSKHWRLIAITNSRTQTHIRHHKYMSVYQYATVYSVLNWPTTLCICSATECYLRALALLICYQCCGHWWIECASYVITCIIWATTLPCSSQILRASMKSEDSQVTLHNASAYTVIMVYYGRYSPPTALTALRTTTSLGRLVLTRLIMVDA